MIAIDTNILVYCHRRDSDWHTQAKRQLLALIESRVRWAIPWPCIHEFLSIATHPRIYVPPTTLLEAVDQVDAWMDVPGLQLLAETDSHWVELRELVLAGQILGPRVHDARIAAICMQHGVTELWTADRDFSRFPLLKSRNPLIS